MKNILFATVLSCGLAISGLAHAEHPYTELEPKFDKGYNSYVGDSDWNQGELEFHGPSERVPYEDLTAAERYAVSGGFTDEGMFEIPWRMRVALLADMYYRQYGSLPAVLDEDAIRMVGGREQISDEELSWYRSPVTGEWAELTNSSFKSGNLYMKPLTTPEKVYLSQFLPEWKRSWFHNLEFSMELYDQGYDWYDCFTEVDPIDGEIWYFRLYGENGVLLSGTIYQR